MTSFLLFFACLAIIAITFAAGLIFGFVLGEMSAEDTHRARGTND